MLPIAVFIVVAIAIIIAVVVVEQIDKKRRAEIIDRLSASGFLAEDGDDPGLLSSLQHLPECSRGRQSLRWHAAAQDGSGLQIVEHRCVVGYGKNRRTILHTIASIPCPPDWPNLSLAPESVFTKLGEMLGWKDLKLDDEVFNKRWRVKSTAEEFAIVALSPALQEWLGLSPPDESWYVGSGRICCVWNGSISADQTLMLGTRPMEFFKRIPPELGAWRALPSSRRPI